VPDEWKPLRHECARYQGKLYSARNGTPGHLALYSEDPVAAALVVPIAAVEEWYDVKLKCDFLGHDGFQVAMESAGSYLIHYLGGDGKWVARAWAEGPAKHPQVVFQQLDQYSYSARVPKDLVENLHEERRDNLKPWQARNPNG
jgi:hypothetical protein